MAYECGVKSCNPCQHVESVVTCPACGKRLIIAPTHEWVFCPDWHRCAFEMTPEKFESEHQRLPELNHSIELKERNRMNNKIAGLISTSVSDAQISLNGILASDPAEAKALAQGIVEALKNSEG